MNACCDACVVLDVLFLRGGKTCAKFAGESDVWGGVCLTVGAQFEPGVLCLVFHSKQARRKTA